MSHTTTPDATDNHNGHKDHEDHDSHHGPHVVPFSMLFTIFAILIVLTFATVGATYVQLGDFNLALALAIAVVKAALVCLYFMHLRWDSPFNGLVLVASFAFVALFIGFALMDSKAYTPEVDAAAVEMIQSDAEAAGQ